MLQKLMTFALLAGITHKALTIATRTRKIVELMTLTILPSCCPWPHWNDQNDDSI